MIHPESAHDLLSEEDLQHHLPLWHNYDPRDVPTEQRLLDEATEWLVSRGIEYYPDTYYLQYVHERQHENDERPENVLFLVAKMISGLAVPYSLQLEVHGRPERVFGTAAQAWLDLWAELNLFGYPDEEEVLKALKKTLRWKESNH